MTWLEDIFNLFGSLICHQLPERTLSAGGALLPVCARDTGIYLGVFVSATYLLILGRWKTKKPPRIVPSIIMCLLMVPMILDGGLSYLGVTESNNISRVITGALFGLPIPIFLIPAAHYDVNGVNGKAVLGKWTELLPIYGLTLILCALLLQGLVPYTLAGFIIIIGMVFLLARICYTVIKRSGRFKGNKLYAITVVAFAVITALLYLISSLVLQPLKAIMLGGAA